MKRKQDFKWMYKSVTRVVSLAFFMSFSTLVVADNQAFNRLQERCNEGESSAQYELALLYLKGDSVNKNSALAAKYLTLAAENGHPLAQFQLGYLYEVGRGVPKDLDIARSWYEAIMERDDEASKKLVATRFDFSNGFLFK